MPPYVIHLPWTDIEPCMFGACSREWAEVLGVSQRTVFRWKRDGIPYYAAEDVAAALNAHPASVWGRAWFVAVARAAWLGETNLARREARRRARARRLRP